MNFKMEFQLLKCNISMWFFCMWIWHYFVVHFRFSVFRMWQCVCMLFFSLSDFSFLFDFVFDLDFPNAQYKLHTWQNVESHYTRMNLPTNAIERQFNSQTRTQITPHTHMYTSRHTYSDTQTLSQSLASMNINGNDGWTVIRLLNIVRGRRCIKYTWFW